MLKLIRGLVLASAFALAFLVNPMFVAGCIQGDDDEPSSERLAEIEAALDERLDEFNGVGSFSFTHDGESYELLLALQRKSRDTKASLSPAHKGHAAWTNMAHACGTKTFYASASACSTNYELALEGTLTLRRTGANAATLVADAPVVGRLDDYSVDLSFEDNTAYFEGNMFRLASLQVTELGIEYGE